MKVSIITVVYNNALTIAGAIDSVLNQTYDNIEYIVVDGVSIDGTLEVIQSYKDNIDIIISEQDNGIYHAMNKGIKLATGDIIGILNADDYFSDNNIVEKIVKQFNNEDIDVVFGDVQFVKNDDIKRIVRYYSSKKFNPLKFKYGFMPAHPSFYTKKDLFNKLGYYKEDYVIAADYELLMRFLYINKLKYKYLEMPFVTMRTGGISNESLKNRFVLNEEIMRACRENGIKTNRFNVYSKYFIKIFELFTNRNE